MDVQLTIIMPTYNKVEYISAALESIFMQKTTYCYQIIIADDCSVDGSIEIAEQFRARYPDIIKVLKSDKNNGLYKNIIKAYGMIRTEYFCVLDPDDYWIDENKIQKALDFLANNQDFTIYATNTIIKINDKEQKMNVEHTAISTFEDYLQKKAVLGCSLGGIFRNVVFKNGIPKKMIDLQNYTNIDTFRGDSFRNIIHLEQGKAYYEPTCDAVYRVTDTGIWQSSSKIKQDLLNCTFFKDMYFYFDKKYDELLYLSYERFLNIESNLLGLIGDDIKEQYIKQLIELKKIFNENLEVLNNVKKSRNNRIKMKDKIRLYFFNKLKSKLEKKRLL